MQELGVGVGGSRGEEFSRGMKRNEEGNEVMRIDEIIQDRKSIR